MQQDTWTHTTTNAEHGTSGALGSPRAWLRRAFDTPSLDDTTFQPGSLTPTEISVAGIWYKKPEGFNIPITGMHRELFRWFEVPVPEQMMRPRTRVPLVPVIGVCAAVPMSEVLHWLRVYKEHGATYTWWKAPENKSVRAVSEKPRRRQLDHARVYKMLDAGMKPADISRELDFPTPNIDYVVKKWRNGVPLINRKRFCNQEELMDACRSGLPVGKVAEKFNVSEAYIYNLLKKAA